MNRSATDCARSRSPSKRKKSLLTSGARAFRGWRPPTPLRPRRWISWRTSTGVDAMPPCSPRAKRLMAAGFEAGPRARPSLSHLESRTTFFASGGRPRSRGWRARLVFGETNAGSGTVTAAAPCDIRRRACKIPLSSADASHPSVPKTSPRRRRRREISERDAWGDSLRPGSKYFFAEHVRGVRVRGR